MRRLVVVGRNAKVWQALRTRPELNDLEVRELRHRDIDDARFSADEEVWVFAYSRVAAENESMLARLVTQGARQLVYLSSSSVVVAERTGCYEYPRVKRLAEQAALRLPGARVLTLGLVYGSPAELPGGRNAATSHDELARFMASPAWKPSAVPQPLMHMVERPLSRPAERMLHALYGYLIHAVGPWPCLLRPLDLLLRLLGLRWYGYTYLANERWTSTMS